MSTLDSVKPQGYAPIRLTSEQIGSFFSRVKQRKVVRPINSESLKITTASVKDRPLPAVNLGDNRSAKVTSSAGKKKVATAGGSRVKKGGKVKKSSAAGSTGGGSKKPQKSGKGIEARLEKASV